MSTAFGDRLATQGVRVGLAGASHLAKSAINTHITVSTTKLAFTILKEKSQLDVMVYAMKRKAQQDELLNKLQAEVDQASAKMLGTVEEHQPDLLKKARGKSQTVPV
jgi:hypothetical protein